MPNKIDITGLRFGKLVVIGDGQPHNGRRSVVCVCDCGNTKTCDPRFLKLGHTKSCGCLQPAVVAKICSERIVHGMTNTPEYQTWIRIKSRCENPNNKKYADYGGRGITVCPRWADSFDEFFSDMGVRPDGCSSIDRIDVNGNYEPENCRWANAMMQGRNKRNNRLVEHNGKSIALSEFCQESGINYRTALYRLNKGLPLPAPPRISTPTKGE